ncbi:TlpA family protein disulfide reductase [Nannocystaceae bacterium ST9]
MDAGSLVGLGIGLGLVVGVALLARRARREELPITPRPSMPAARAPAPIAPAHVIVELRAGVDLGEQIRQHALEAESRGLRPFVEFTASWCPPSAAFDREREHPLMVQAFAGIYLIQVDIDEFGGFDYLRYGFKVPGVPIFFELDAEGRATGRQIISNAWGPDIPENMSRVLGAFFRG